MKIVPFKAIDWYLDDPLEPIEAPLDIAQRLEDQGISMSLFDDEGCLGCGGMLRWPNNCTEVWVRIDRRGFMYKREGLRAIKEGFSVIMNVCETILFCWVDTKWPKAERMVQWLGFTPTSKTKELNGSIYKQWTKNGDDSNDSRSGDVSRRADTAR